MGFALLKRVGVCAPLFWASSALAQAPTASPQATAVPPDFWARSSPWVDVTFAGLSMDNRVTNLLSVGVQGGAYLFKHLRLSARLAVPFKNAADDYPRVTPPSHEDGNDLLNLRSRDISVLYGASVGLIVTNSKTVVFGPGITLLRSDVADYGTSLAFALPFEWTTAQGLRIGAEVGVGHAFGGSVRQTCDPDVIPGGCVTYRIDREGGMTLLAQLSIGWALGSL